MEAHDLSQNPRIASLSKLTRALKQSRSPIETIQTVRRGLGEAYGFTAMVMLSTRGLADGQYRVAQAQLGDETLDESHGADLNALGPVQTGGIVGAIVARQEPQLIQNVDWSNDPVFGHTLAGYESLMAIPFAGDHLTITWVIILKRPPEEFTEMQLEEAMLRVALVGSLMDRQVLAERLERANAQIDRDARQVGELQRSLLPAALPEVSGLEIAVHYEPSGCAGGDFYDFFRLDDDAAGDSDQAADRWCIFIGDAAGHGLAAAVVMAILQSVLHSHPAGLGSPAELLAHANRQLCGKNIGGFVTAFLAIYDHAARRLSYAAGGHPPPLLKRSRDGQVLPLNAEMSYPLGIDVTEVFNDAAIQLEEGDTLLLYTDGITEARDLQRELFGSEKVEQMLRRQTGPPADLIKQLRTSVELHQQGQPPVDDQTIVAVKVV